MSITVTRAATAALFTLAASTAVAQPADVVSDARARDVHLDVEVDPTAYVLSGFSVHVGLGWNHLRVDLGAYAMDLPELLHGNDGWDVSLTGAGAKVQWFVFREQRGLFVDLGVGVSRREHELVEARRRGEHDVVSLGASVGYRFAIAHGFYATPWAGLNVDLEDTTTMLGGRTFEQSRVTPFAAIHVGYAFR